MICLVDCREFALNLAAGIHCVVFIINLAFICSQFANFFSCIELI